MPIPTLVIPANYDLWLTGLKLHLDRHRGSQAELARHLAKSYEISPAAAQVKISRIINGHRKPAIDTFLDIAAWLQDVSDDAST